MQDKVDYLRPFDEANKKGVRQGNYRYKKGTTGVLKETVKRIPFEVVSETVAAMDTSWYFFAGIRILRLFTSMWYAWLIFDWILKFNFKDSIYQT